ncbi:hypothetical protein [Roseovarius sp. D22-M7]|uniref:hypothetical protein n=1 Tax=Roseovarius sp. D22-M7 TaxID=3127116 RepID=UPI00300FDC17
MIHQYKNTCARLFIGLLWALFVWAGLASHAYACTVSEEGHLQYNATAKVMQYCDGTNWIGMNLPGSGSGGCTNPTAPEGAIVFNGNRPVTTAGLFP